MAWGKSNSQDPYVSQVTPDAVPSAPPPPRRAALAPAVHPPETLQWCPEARARARARAQRAKATTRTERFEERCADRSLGSFWVIAPEIWRQGAPTLAGHYIPNNKKKAAELPVQRPVSHAGGRGIGRPCCEVAAPGAPARALRPHSPVLFPWSLAKVGHNNRFSPTAETKPLSTRGRPWVEPRDRWGAPTGHRRSLRIAQGAALARPCHT